MPDNNLIGKNTNPENSGYDAELRAKLAAGIDNSELGKTPNIVMPGEVVQNTPNNKP